MSPFANQPFWHKSIRNLVIAFGEFFSGIKIQKVNAQGRRDQLIEIPIEFGPKNKWLERINAEPSFSNTKVQQTLPRLAFEIVDYSYDANRAIGPKGHFNVGTIGTNRAKVFNPTPYDVGINLYSICKTQEESMQIFEQIAPVFKPSITMTIEVIPEFSIKKDVPLVLRNSSMEDSYLGSPEQMRTVIQTYSFIAQMDLFGPIPQSDKVIKIANADLSGTMPDDINSTTLALNDDYRYTAAVNPKAAMPSDDYIIDEFPFGVK